MLVPRRMLSGAPLRARLAPAAVRLTGPYRLASTSHSVSPTSSANFDHALDTGLLADINRSAQGGARASSSFAGSDTTQSRSQDAEEEDLELNFARREERMSPAAVLGSKRLGVAVLPQPLVEGITAAIKECENPKLVRTAYLELLEPTPKHKERGGSRNSYDHALARAAAFLPTQYSAARNVVGELNARLGGGLVGPVLEITGTLGAGLWATYDVAGPDAVKGYALVHRTRYGLALAERFAETIPVNKQFKRDFTFIEMQRPQVAMSTFALSGLPKKLGRIDHLNNLLSVGSEHIIIIERSSDEAWALMKEAREYLLRQSTADDPLHITAPCASDGACPRAEGKEACAFGQRLQRPLFLRKTKHAKGGEEVMAYTYLIVSRGKRPVAQVGEVPVGRMGAVGKEEVERILSRETGRTEIRPVEGGEKGDLEVVEIPAPNALAIDNTDPTDPAVQAQLRNEAYSWPRIVAPVMKRSGHVVMDMCTKEGEIHRIRVAKSHGKQEYYDARKLGWGDLYPHQPKNEPEIRTRGVRRLDKVDHDAEQDVLQEILGAINASPLDAQSEEPIVKFDDEDPIIKFNDGPEEFEIKFDPPTVSAVEDDKFRSTGDADLDALLKKLGGTDIGAELVDEQPAAPKKFKSSSGRVKIEHSTLYDLPTKRKFSTSARRLAKDEEDIDEECALGDGGFSASSLSDPPTDRPVDKPYPSVRHKRPVHPVVVDANAEPAAAGEGIFSAWSLSDPPHRGDTKRSFSTSAVSRGKKQEDEEFYMKEVVEEDCAPGEESFSRSSLSDPDYERAPGQAPYYPPRPKRPEQPIAVNPNAEPASVGEGGWSRWSLSDPPIRSDEDVNFYFREDVEEDCAPGEESFSRSSLSDPDYERPAEEQPYLSPRPKRPEHPIVIEKAEPAAAGEGGFSRWSLADPPYRGAGGKREYSTMARRPCIAAPSASLSRSMSVAPAERLTGAVSRPKLNVGSLHNIYAKGTPITVLTAYDYPTSLLASRAGIDIILVGDSLAQVALGYPTTVPLTLEEMAHHVRAVARGSGSSFVLVDLPFGYAEASVADGVKAAVTLMKAGADGVKIEGGREMLPLVRRLSETGIPVMSHIGLQPQRVAATGYKAQGRSAAAAIDLIQTAQECEAAGAFSLLLEAIPHAVGKAITDATNIPSIGIGAGNGCSGQVLVITDMIATYDIAAEGEEDSFKVPKFVRLFANVGKDSRKAVDAYIDAVRSRDFPAAPKETYAMPKDQMEEFTTLLKKRNSKSNNKHEDE